MQGSNGCLFIAKYKYIVHGWQRGKYINSISVIFVVLAMPCITICTTDANRPEKKDQVLNPIYTAWLSFQ